MTVSDIFTQHLYPTYGDIDAQQLQDNYKKVATTTYDVSYPPDVVYECIEDLMDMSEAANAPFTERQCVNLAYNIINRTGRFEYDLHAWLQRPPLQQTWINFKQHFTDAHKQLKKIGALKIRNTMEFQQANIVQQMVLAAVEDAITTAPTSTAPMDIPSAPSTMCTPVPSSTNTDVSTITDPTRDSVSYHTANASIMETNKQMMQQMQEMMKMMQMQMQQGQQNNSRQNGNGYNRQRNDNRGNSNNNRTREWAYCWTHGFCSHSSRNCSYKAQGHKDKATLTDNMGGNQKGKTKWQRNTRNE